MVCFDPRRYLFCQQPAVVEHAQDLLG
jgi:hypothetical protein